MVIRTYCIKDQYLWKKDTIKNINKPLNIQWFLPPYRITFTQNHFIFACHFHHHLLLHFIFPYKVFQKNSHSICVSFYFSSSSVFLSVACNFKERKKERKYIRFVFYKELENCSFLFFLTLFYLCPVYCKEGGDITLFLFPS